MNNELLKYDIAQDLQAINKQLKQDGYKDLIGYATSDEKNYFLMHGLRRASKDTDLEVVSAMISALRELIVDSQEPLRICSVCGHILIENGYVEDMGSAYYCSDECLHTQYTDQEWKQMCEDNDQTYWTEFI